MSDEWLLHSRDGNSFHFKHVDYPTSHFNSFTLTYLRGGNTVLTGDMGSLIWKRQEPEYDYAFPRKQDEDIRYFAEKVNTARADIKITDWNEERAKTEIIESIICENELENIKESEFPDEIKEKIDHVKEATWGSEYSMYEDLIDFDPYGQWDEVEPGRDYTYDIKRKFEMVKSVSELVLDVVKGV